MNFTKEVINWYSTNNRSLPWRDTKNPYFIWLSEIILQQTQVKQGLPYYLKFIEVYPTVFDLANAPEEAVLKLWQGLGYYSRARNLHKTAKMIVNDYGGLFPNSYSELLKLKGIGDYTASAIASIAFDKPTAVVDGNVYRLLSRYFGIETPINSTKGVKEFKVLAQSLIDANRPAEFNQAIMEFGARQCKPQSPDCGKCPLQNSCHAFHNNNVGVLPIKLKKAKIKTKYFNYLVILDSKGRTIFEKRTQKGIWQNLYQFPLVETKSELTTNAFKNAVAKLSLLKGMEFDFSLYNGVPVIHKLSHQHLYTKFWILEVDGIFKNSIPISKLKTFPTPVLIANFIEEFYYRH